PLDLHAAWQRYLMEAIQLGKLTSTSAEEVLADRRDPEGAAGAVQRAIAAFGEGDGADAFRHLFAARVCDPFDDDIREAYEANLAEQQEAAADGVAARRREVLGAHADP